MIRVTIEMAEEYESLLQTKAQLYGLTLPQFIMATMVANHPLDKKLTKKKIDPTKVEAPEDRAAKFLAKMKAEPIYKGLDIDAEFARCRNWCETHRRQFTPGTVVNWLNNASKNLMAEPKRTASISAPAPKPLCVTVQEPSKEDWEAGKKRAQEIIASLAAKKSIVNEAKEIFVGAQEIQPEDFL